MAKNEKVYEVVEQGGKYAISRKADGVVLAKHASKKDAEHQAAGLEARAARQK